MIKSGNGLFTNEELIDTIINDVNAVIKNALSGNYVLSCSYITQITQKLVNLKKGIAEDMNHRNKTIEDLKQQLKLYNPELTDVTPEQFLNDLKKDGAENGGN